MTEEKRLEVLHRTALLDTEAEELFDRFVRLASVLTDSPISLISLLDADRQWFKAAEGLEVRQTPRAWAFCDHAIKSEGLFEVPDALEDERFADNPLVAGAPEIRFYAGVPLRVGGQFPIGTLCVIDQQPRELDERHRQALIDLAAILTREIETNHLAEVRADRASAARAAALEIEHQMRNMFSKVGAIIDMTAREAQGTSEMASAARRRVIALSQANEVCLRNHFGNSPLKDIVEASLGPIRNRLGVAIETGGDDVSITPAAASVVAPLVNELAHDAMARGSLSETTRAELSWNVSGRDLELHWRENAGRGSRTPFESAYLRDIAPTALRGRVFIDEEDGPVFSIVLPLSLISNNR